MSARLKAVYHELAAAGLPPLIRQHVSPPLPATPLVRRQRLLDMLDLATAERPLSLLVAPAGTGKTALLIDWAARRRAAGADLAWISLAPLLGSPLPFAGILLAALAQSGALPAEPPDWVWQGPAPAPFARLLTAGAPALLPLAWALNVLAERAAPLTLVLDGFESIADPATLEIVGFLLSHAPPQLRLIIASRATPPLPVARLRAAGSLAEIPPDALRWSVEEAAPLLHPIGLSGAQLAALVDYTEGWATGLSLAAMALGAGADRDSALAEFMRGHPFVLDYLRDEVLRREPEPLQRFLLKSATLPLLSAAIGAGLLADGEPDRPSVPERYGGFPSYQAALAEVVSRGLFLQPVARRAGVYRYHPLFAQMLRLELAQRFPHWVEALQRAAGTPAQRPAPPAPAPVEAKVEPLSAREHEILALMALGCSNRTIAGRLSIVEGTVKTHLKHIFGKLGASNRTEAVAIARSLQLIV